MSTNLRSLETLKARLYFKKARIGNIAHIIKFANMFIKTIFKVKS